MQSPQDRNQTPRNRNKAIRDWSTLNRRRGIGRKNKKKSHSLSHSASWPGKVHYICVIPKCNGHQRRTHAQACDVMWFTFKNSLWLLGEGERMGRQKVQARVLSRKKGYLVWGFGIREFYGAICWNRKQSPVFAMLYSRYFPNILKIFKLNMLLWGSEKRWQTASYANLGAPYKQKGE